MQTSASAAAMCRRPSTKQVLELQRKGISTDLVQLRKSRYLWPHCARVFQKSCAARRQASHVGIAPACDLSTTVRAIDDEGILNLSDLLNKLWDVRFYLSSVLTCTVRLTHPNNLTRYNLLWLGELCTARPRRVDTVFKPTKSDSHRTFGTRMCPPFARAQLQQHFNSQS